MKVFVGEYVCGGGLPQQTLDDASSSIRAEGAAMLHSIASDLAEVAEIVVPIDPRFENDFREIGTFKVDCGRPLWAQWFEAARDCDCALIVAPESGGTLAKAVAALRAGGVSVLASGSDFLRIASDKLLTAKRLLAAGIPHPFYVTKADRKFEKRFPTEGPFVVKPRDGCGTQRIRLFETFQHAFGELEDHDLLQHWVTGEPVSVAFVASETQRIFLPAVKQKLTTENLAYSGGSGPVDEELQRRANSLASRVIAEMPADACGFVGIDLVLGRRPSEDFVIEINPRLTTSYVGLRRLIRGNLAARLLDLESGPVVCEQMVDSVSWTPDGQVWVNAELVE